MRITGNRLIDQAAAATAKNQSTVADVTNQLTSGMRVQTPSDDPSAWAAAQRAKLHKTLSQGTGAAIAASKDRLDQTDGALATLGDIVSSVRALAVQGASASYDANARSGLGVQVKALFESALAAANQQSPDGEYLLAGSTSLTQPFDATGTYQGDATARSIATDEHGTQVVSIAGSALTASAGVDILPLLSQVATALSTNNVASLQTSLGGLDTAIKQLSTARASAGSAMAVLADATTAHASLETQLSSQISSYVETDSVAAASELARASNALEVSRTVSSHIVSLLAPTTA